MDSTAALSLIRNGVDRKHPYVNKEWVVHLTHIYCEANRVADHLASRGHEDQLGVCYLMSPPKALGPFLHDDVMSVARPRAVVVA